MRSGHRTGPAIITGVHFTVGGGTYGEKIDQIKPRQQVFEAAFDHIYMHF